MTDPTGSPTGSPSARRERARGEGAEAPDAAARDAPGRLVHDLRNTLNTLSMHAELLGLELDGAGADPGALRDGLRAIGRAVDELDRGLAELEARERDRPDRSADG